MNILDWFSKNTEITNLMKVRPVVMLFHVDGYDEVNIHF